MLNDKRVRYLVIAVLVVILALGVLSLLSTLFQMIVPPGHRHWGRFRLLQAGYPRQGQRGGAARHRA